MKGHGSDFLLLETLDRTELKFYHIPNQFVMPQTIYIDDGKKMNFAFSKVDGSANNLNLVACTFDAKWSNKCELYPISLHESSSDLGGLSWMQIGPAFPFDMVDGMCAHQIIVSGEYIVYSCSKMF